MSNLIIREPKPSDVQEVRPMLEEWVTDSKTGAPLTDEIADDLATLRASLDGRNPMRWLVAEEDGHVLGIMGIRPPTEEMLKYTTTSNPTELTFALVSGKARGKGTGTALVNALAERALGQHSTEFVVASSLRYKKLGWPFWEKLFGEHVGVAKGYGGSGGDARVWRKALD